MFGNKSSFEARLRKQVAARLANVSGPRDYFQQQINAIETAREYLTGAALKKFNAAMQPRYDQYKDRLTWFDNQLAGLQTLQTILRDAAKV